MAETMLAVNEHVHWELQDVDPTGEIPSFLPGDYPVLTLGDGTVIVISGHPAAKGNAERFAALMGRPELLDDPRFATVAARLQHYDDLLDALQQWARTYDDASRMEHDLAAHGYAMGVLRTVREVADSAWAEERGAIVAVPDRGEGTVRIPNSPWHFSDAETGVRGRPAYRGEHNHEVLRELLGLDDDELHRLVDEGVLSSRVPDR